MRMNFHQIRKMNIYMKKVIIGDTDAFRGVGDSDLDLFILTQLVNIKFCIFMGRFQI
jgi:hypothetical protein